jgi:hypothetical protein
MYILENIKKSANTHFWQKANILFIKAGCTCICHWVLNCYSKVLILPLLITKELKCQKMELFSLDIAIFLHKYTISKKPEAQDSQTQPMCT